MARFNRGKKKKPSKNPSYKGGLFLSNPDKRIHKGDRFYINHPVIDKISLVGNIFPIPRVKDNFVDKISKEVKWAEKREKLKPEWKKLFSKSPLERHYDSNPNSKYKFNFKLWHSASKQYALISLNPKNPTDKHFRIEFNPAKLGRDGVKFIRKWYSKNIATKGGIHFDKLISRKGCITRIDLAIDIIGLDIPDMILNYEENGKSCRYYAKEGPLESYYADVKPGKTTALKIYTKTNPENEPEEDEEEEETEEDIKDTSRPEAVSSQSQIVSPKVTPKTRVEKIIETNRALTDLCSLKPHFKDVKIFLPFKPAPEKLPEEEHHWHMFLDSVRNRGFENALNLIPEPMRGQYKKLFKSCTRNVFEPYNNPDTWEEMIERALRTSGLMPSDWSPNKE